LQWQPPPPPAPAAPPSRPTTITPLSLSVDPASQPSPPPVAPTPSSTASCGQSGPHITLTSEAGGQASGPVVSLKA